MSCRTSHAAPSDCMTSILALIAIGIAQLELGSQPQPDTWSNVWLVTALSPAATGLAIAVLVFVMSMLARENGGAVSGHEHVVGRPVRVGEHRPGESLRRVRVLEVGPRAVLGLQQRTRLGDLDPCEYSISSTVRSRSGEPGGSRRGARQRTHSPGRSCRLRRNARAGPVRCP
jgi:hypothetical protein